MKEQIKTTRSGKRGQKGTKSLGSETVIKTCDKESSDPVIIFYAVFFFLDL